MRLKSLEIKGFKSFADRTIINLDNQITGIVDPNGCGKSNIVDAIRWVIGEHKIKTLRSDNLEDLTFNGQFKTYFNLGVIAQKKGQTKTAIEYFTKSTVENENFCPGYYELGNIHFQNAHYEQALKDYRSAGMGLCFNNAEPFLKQADTLIKLHRYTEARLKLEDVYKRFMATKFEEIARNKLNQLNQIEGIQDHEQFGQAPNEHRDISSPSF